MNAFSDEKLRRSILDSSLSDISKKSYVDRLNSLQNQTGVTIFYMMTNPKKMLLLLQQKYNQAQTQKAFVNVVLTLFKRNQSLLDKHSKEHALWKHAFDEIHKLSEQKYNDNKPSTKQQSSFIPWEKVIAARDKLPRDSIEYLWLSCHTMIPPIRADLDRVRIVYENDLSNKNLNEKSSPNFLIINRKLARTHGWEMTLVLTAFKTAKTMKSYEKKLPALLSEIIKKSLLRFPREYLFVSTVTGKPFENTATYTRFANRLLSRVLSPYKVTISMLRHIFVSHFDHGKLTSGEKHALAKDMMHSPAMFDKYRLFFSDNDDENQPDSYILDIDESVSLTNKKKRCKCECFDL